jgi:hypothetical protein
MRIIRNTLLVVCLAMAVTGALLVRQQRVLRPQDQVLDIVFWALAILVAVGMLAFAAQFFARRTASISACLFFGLLAGIMATNFLTDAVSGTKFTTITGYLTSYGLELFFVVLSVAGLVLFQRAAVSAFAEPSASPNGGPAIRPGNPGAGGGPSSVS